MSNNDTDEEFHLYLGYCKWDWQDWCVIKCLSVNYVVSILTNSQTSSKIGFSRSHKPVRKACFVLIVINWELVHFLNVVDKADKTDTLCQTVFLCFGNHYSYSMFWTSSHLVVMIMLSTVTICASEHAWLRLWKTVKSLHYTRNSALTRCLCLDQEIGKTWLDIIDVPLFNIKTCWRLFLSCLKTRL